MKYKIVKIENSCLYLDKAEDDGAAKESCAGCGGCSVFGKKYSCSVIKYPLLQDLENQWQPGQTVNLILDSKKIIIASLMVFVIPLIILFISLYFFSGFNNNQFLIFLASLIPAIIYYCLFRKIINSNPYSIESID
ncbi:MAG TPA: SoxR reducing system RseC family protein [bacterium]|nr:SoxR reducing system RseC family protein [bacterium]HPN30556.1 SoxR reducing system RseC family protein [bacterium]